MHFELNEEQRMFRQAVRRFAETEKRPFTELARHIIKILSVLFILKDQIVRTQRLLGIFDNDPFHFHGNRDIRITHVTSLQLISHYHFCYFSYVQIYRTDAYTSAAARAEMFTIVVHKIAVLMHKPLP